MHSLRNIQAPLTYGESSFDNEGNTPWLFNFAAYMADLEEVPTEGEER